MTKSPTILTRRNIFRAGAGLAVAATATPLLTPASAKAENARQADAEPNPEAQKTNASATKNAAAPSRPGAILVSQFGPVKIHSYLSPVDGLQVNTQMIEGLNAIVIFDGQLLLPYADEVASYVQTLGKPVDRIILSHA